ncbi:MAG: DUF1415 family protein [Deltaproteobacteria bacterium]|nr:DUF1415 family protein [Deltaproteobacteria bacterium]
MSPQPPGNPPLLSAISVHSAPEAKALPRCTPPFAALPRISDSTRAAIAKAALAANDRYLYDFIEEYSFCPFARAGREAGQTVRYVHYADSLDLEPMLNIMEEVARDERIVVAQLILPLVEVTPEQWQEFCDTLTALGHARRGGAPVLAFAALHPQLSYTTSNPWAMIPLFRRAPDPTLQWARLQSLEELYAGRDTQTRVVDPADVLEYVRSAPKPRPPLYYRVTETNAKMAQLLGLAQVEAKLAAMAVDARATYHRLLMADNSETDHG